MSGGGEWYLVGTRGRENLNHQGLSEEHRYGSSTHLSSHFVITPQLRSVLNPSLFYPKIAPHSSWSPLAESSIALWVEIFRGNRPAPLTRHVIGSSTISVLALGKEAAESATIELDQSGKNPRLWEHDKPARHVSRLVHTQGDRCVPDETGEKTTNGSVIKTSNNIPLTFRCGSVTVCTYREQVYPVCGVPTRS